MQTATDKPKPYHKSTVENNGFTFLITQAVEKRDEKGDAIKVVCYAYDKQNGKQVGVRRSKAAIHGDALQQFKNKMVRFALDYVPDYEIAT